LNIGTRIDPDVGANLVAVLQSADTAKYRA
jgi:hypothetical protein